MNRELNVEFDSLHRNPVSHSSNNELSDKLVD